MRRLSFLVAMSVALGLAGACSSTSGGSDGGGGAGGSVATGSGGSAAGHGGTTGGGGTTGAGGTTGGSGGSADDGGANICAACSQAGNALACPDGVGTAGEVVHCANYGDICCGSDQQQYRCQDCVGSNNCVWYPLCVNTGGAGGSN